jgi:hypothetical protein
MGKIVPLTIDEALTAFDNQMYGGNYAPTPLHRQVLAVMEAAPYGLIATDVVEAVLGRKVTREEDDLIVLRIEEPEGCA